MNDEERVGAVQDKARRLAAEVIWTHKIMEKKAEDLRRQSFVFQLIVLLGTAVIAAGLVVTIVGSNLYAVIVSAVLTTITLFCELASCAYGYPTRIQNAAWSAKGFLELRETILDLLSDLKSMTCKADNAEYRFANCESHYVELCRNAPPTNKKAVDKACVSLKEKNDSTYDEKEIDELLPEFLRSGR